MEFFGLGFAILVSLFALRRASKIFFWDRTEGTVLGPIEGVDSASAVLIRYTAPDGKVREFPSALQFGHRYRSPEGERIPFAKGHKVSILLNPRNFDQAEMNSSMLFIIPLGLLVLSAALAFILLK